MFLQPKMLESLPDILFQLNNCFCFYSITLYFCDNAIFGLFPFLFLLYPSYLSIPYTVDRLLAVSYILSLSLLCPIRPGCYMLALNASSHMLVLSEEVSRLSSKLEHFSTIKHCEYCERGEESLEYLLATHFLSPFTVCLISGKKIFSK